MSLKHDPEPERAPPDPDDADGAQDPDGPRIRCPKCGWRPRQHDRWTCLCGHSWNTFDTGGRCPGCGERWDHTQCPRCAAWSPHVAWYDAGDGS